MEGHLFYRDGKVEMSDELFDTKPFQALYKRDKHSGKPNWDNWKYYFYHVYDRDSLYFREPERTKKTKILKKLGLSHEKAKDFDLLLKDCIEFFNEIQFTKEERLLNDIEIDCEEYIDHLQSIKYTKTVTKKVTVNHPAEGDKPGKTETTETTYEEENIDEKNKAIFASKGIFEYIRALKKDIATSGKKSKSKSGRARLYEE